MKQRRHYTAHRLSRDAERLVWLAKGLADSGSRAEDVWWETELNELIERLLAAAQDDALNQALDRLHETHARAYEKLADLIEASSESQCQNGRCALLIALPILAWSRYRIPDSKMSAGLLANLRVQLKAHVLANDVRLALADTLISPDQLPTGFVATRQLSDAMTEAARQDADLAISPGTLPETGHFIADLRYVLAMVDVPSGQPVFRWQESDGRRETALQQWRSQVGPSLQAAMPGCQIQLQLPDAFFSAWRLADQAARAYSLAATAAYLQGVLNIPIEQLQAIAAPYYDHRLVEWRIGFARKGEDSVLHGVVWPLLGAEDESSDVVGEIEQTLKQSGLRHILLLDQRMPVEYCDDCGAPMFPNADCESVHAAMPETESTTVPTHLH